MNRLTLLLPLFLLGYFSTLQAQVISKFTWDGTDPSKAVIGPDATSISSSAVISQGGINPGSPKRDINMVLPGSTFNVDGIDISIDYQRDESVASFFKRGSDFTMKAGNNFGVSFRLQDPNDPTNFTTVNSGDVYAIPNDDVFRTYRFYYLPASGQAALFVDGTIVWAYDGADNIPLYWTLSQDVTIGYQMDGSGRNRKALDNLEIAQVTDTPFGGILSVTWLNIDAQVNQENDILLSWETADETQNAFFDVEHSTDGIIWETIGSIAGQGTTSNRSIYSYLHMLPGAGTHYYRVRQEDFDGSYSYSDIVSVQIENDLFALEVYPNPSTDYIRFKDQVKAVDVVLYSIQGQLLLSRKLNIREALDIHHLPAGQYIIQIHQDGQVIHRTLIKK